MKGSVNVKDEKAPNPQQRGCNYLSRGMVKGSVNVKDEKAPNPQQWRGNYLSRGKVNNNVNVKDEKAPNPQQRGGRSKRARRHRDPMETRAPWPTKRSKISVP